MTAMLLQPIQTRYAGTCSASGKVGQVADLVIESAVLLVLRIDGVFPMAELDAAKPQETGKPAAKSGNQRAAAWLPRAMRCEQAADYLSISRSMWLKLVAEGKMPPGIKIGAMTLWDRVDIDDAFEDLKRGDGEPSENTVHKRLRELQDERRRGKGS
jgi:predicted DNA-binding transcriptional regulator AlpA